MNDPSKINQERIQKAARRFAEAMCRLKDVDPEELPLATKYLMDGYELIARKAMTNQAVQE